MRKGRVRHRNPWEDRLRAPRGSTPGRGDGKPRAYSPSSAISPSNEIVVKIISYSKTVKGLRNVVDYIASHGGKEKGGPVVFREDGTPLGKDAAQELVESWDLMPDTENFSKKYRDASPEDRRVMADSVKYRKRQTVHMMVSLPVLHAAVSDGQLHGIVQDYLKPFRDEGYQAVYAVHRHQARPHAHIIMTMEGLDSRLRLQKEQIDKLRTHAKEVARSHGIHVEATRRIQRESFIERVALPIARRQLFKRLEELTTERERLRFELAGRAAVRVEARKVRAAARAVDNKAARIEDQAPIWFARHGEAARATLAGQGREHLPTIDPVSFPKLGQKTNQALEVFMEQRFVSPGQARSLFLEMAAENPRFAFWNVNNRPQVFGSVRDGFEGSLRQSDVRLSKAWRGQVMDRLAAMPAGERADQRDKEKPEETRVQKTEAEKERIRDTLAAVNREIGQLERSLGIEDRPAITPKHDYFTASMKPSSSLIEKQTPIWYQRHGVAAQAALLRRDPAELQVKPVPAVPVEIPQLGQKTNIALEAFMLARFERPAEARASFLEMAAEKPRTAFWYANHRPEVFGATREGEAKLLQKDVRLSAKWREQVKSRLIAIAPRQPEVLEVIEHDTRQLVEVRRLKGAARRASRDLTFLEASGHLPTQEACERTPESAKQRSALEALGDVSQAVKDFFRNRRADGWEVSKSPAPERTPVMPTPAAAPGNEKQPSLKGIERQMTAAKGRDKGPDRSRER